MADDAGASAAAAAAASDVTEEVSERGEEETTTPPSGRDRWLQIALKDKDREFTEYDVRISDGPDIKVPPEAHELRVRGRSLAEALMAFIDYLNDLPDPLWDHVSDVYDTQYFGLPDDDLEAKRKMRSFAEFPYERHFFSLYHTHLLDEIKPRRVLMVRDMPGTTGRSVKRARCE